MHLLTHPISHCIKDANGLILPRPIAQFGAGLNSKILKKLIKYAAFCIAGF